MANRLFVGTRKGLFVLARRGGGWDVAETHFLGDPVSAVLPQPESALVALDLGHFGAKLWRVAADGSRQELTAPAFPPKPEDATDDPHPWSLGRIWALEPGGVKGRVWAGTMPGAVFRSDDDGATWALNEPLWRMPDRRKWFGVAGGEQPGVSGLLVDPRDPRSIRVGIATGGVWATADEGGSWRVINRGMHNEYMPPELRDDPMSQDIHQIAQCRAAPDVLWCQHHSTAYRSTDGGESWTELAAIRPSNFGFAVAAHPKDPDTAWYVPAAKDERRIPVDAQMAVARTRDGGRSFEVLRDGLPQRHAYDLVYRHGLGVDASGTAIAVGTTSGGLWVSEDGGDRWTAPDARLPPVTFVRFDDA